MNNIYEITFNTKKGGFRSYLIHIEAKTAKAAKEKAVSSWYNHRPEHMFHINCRKVKESEVIDFSHWFKFR